MTWIPPSIPLVEPPDSPFEVAVLDVRPVTSTLEATVRDPAVADNVAWLGASDGRVFADAEPSVQREVACELVYPTDTPLQDGVLFGPQQLEHKWALFVHGHRLLAVRSWTRTLVAVATLEERQGAVVATAIRGTVSGETEGDEQLVRLFDALVRTHALEEVWPVPLPSEGLPDALTAAMWCSSLFGERAAVAATAPPPADLLPEVPLRTDSLLHLAAAQGDRPALERLLAAGFGAASWSRDGLTPLMWAMVQDDLSLGEALLAGGATVHDPTADGTPPLKIAAQEEGARWVAWLLDAGADPNGADSRGFTALHVAAELGLVDALDRLLAAGADPKQLSVDGLAPADLARAAGRAAVARRLERARG